MHYIYDTANGILRTLSSDLDSSQHAVDTLKIHLQQLTQIPRNSQIFLNASGIELFKSLREN